MNSYMAAMCVLNRKKPLSRVSLSQKKIKTNHHNNGSSGRREEYFEPARTTRDHLPAVFPTPPLPKTQPQRVRIIGSVKEFGITGQAGRKVKDDHGVAGEDLVDVELVGGEVLEGGGVHEDGDVAPVVQAQS